MVINEQVDAGTRPMAGVAGTCRFCRSPLRRSFVDLGMSPLCNEIVSTERLDAMEPFFPLHAYVCEECFLVQLQEYVAPGEIFGDYSYFSSFSASWLEHARRYVEMIMQRRRLDSSSLVVEIASNDGYLLQNFVAAGVGVLGVEPAGNVAEVARAKGVPTLVEFFGRRIAEDLVAAGKQADLIIGNNVLAHVPDLNDLVAGLKVLLARGGVITMEFPHLMRLMTENQFDTIYHEHFSYFSFLTVERVFAAHGLTVVDVEELPTHGGSIRIHAGHAEDPGEPVGPRVIELRQRELRAGFADIEHYLSFEPRVQATKRQLLSFLIMAREEGATVAGYGAPGKGNTLLNYCGIRSDLMDYTVDLSPHKQGHHLPGTHIPIMHPDRIRETRPDYLLILPWNLREEIMDQMAVLRTWGGRFVVPIPTVTVYD